MELILALVLGSLCYCCSTADIPWAVITTESPQQPFYSGDRVTLRCDITQGEGWQYQWVRNGSSLQGSMNRTITISLPDESGLYRCSGRRGHLQTYESPGIPIVFGALPATLTLDPQSPVFTGENVTLKCEIGSYGGWTYKWYEGSNSDPVFESVENTFTIRAAESNETKYWCRGERTDRPTASERSNEVNIQVMALSRTTLTVEPRNTVFIGETVILKCEIDSLGGWTYKWYKDNMSEPLNMTVESNIIITANVRSDEGRYWCQAEKTDRPTISDRSNDVYIHVKALPKPKLVIEPRGPMFIGENVTLKCEFKFPRGWKYKWYKGNSSESFNASDTNTSTIKVAKSDEGLYRCQGQRRDRATSSHMSNEVSIHVKALPTPKLTIEPQNHVFPGQTVTFKCEVKSSYGWKYKWYKENNPEPVARSETNTTIKHVVETDEGTYWCQGERRDRPTSSQPSKKVHLHMMPLPKAKLTAEPQSPVSTETMVTLTCVIESHSNWTYKWYKDKKNNLVIEGNNFTITRATDSDEGTYWCQGVRRERPTSSQLSNSVPVGKRDSGSSLLIMGVAVAGGVAGGVVLTIIVLKVVPRCCRRQTGAVSNTSTAGPGLAGRNTTDEYDGEGLPIYETIELTEPSRPVMDTVYDKLSLSKMGMLEDPSDAGLCTLGGNASPLSSPYSLAE
ncbi:Fc receptor-like protein 5 isoform X2 [Alosa pseudoharengus]|uniref:Fc receptor-like protein 5 isoform X2 n=1 Tax=Alosa pseudoharengus TaxID=34774 RepID=UPI003F8A8CB4